MWEKNPQKRYLWAVSLFLDKNFAFAPGNIILKHQ